MSAPGTIRRYALIIEKIGQEQYPSFEALKDHLLDHGFEVSDRTIQRDIEEIRFDFGIEITYDRHRNGYYIDRELSVNMENFLSFLKIAHTAGLLADSLQESKESLNYIAFEAQGTLRGNELLKPLLMAIRNRRKISFTYESFSTGKKTKYSVRPYLLKEYANRWYLVGTLIGSDEFRTFGIDRVLDLHVRKETFRRQPKADPRSLFEHTQGLGYSTNKREEVILSFTPLQGKYIKALPLHHSQVVLKENKKELRVKLDIVPNYELKQQILMLGETVQVIRPGWLADEVKESLKAALKKYK